MYIYIYVFSIDVYTFLSGIGAALGGTFALLDTLTSSSKELTAFKNNLPENIKLSFTEWYFAVVKKFSIDWSSE